MSIIHHTHNKQGHFWQPIPLLHDKWNLNNGLKIISQRRLKQKEVWEDIFQNTGKKLLESFQRIQHFMVLKTKKNRK